MKAKESPLAPSAAFKEFDHKLSQLHALIASGKGDDDSADELRQEMERPYHRLSKDEVAHFESIAIEFKQSRSAKRKQNKTILSRDVEIEGSLAFSGELLFDGKLRGEVVSDGELVVGENATVQGEIRIGSVIVYGRLGGNVVVTRRCELKSNCVLQGDLKTPRLVIEEGATFTGRSEVTSASSAKSVSAKPEIIPQETTGGARAFGSVG